MRLLILLPVLAMIVAIPGDTSGFPRGGGGGGARGGGGGGARAGGGGARPAAPAHTPSFTPSRPAPSRPSAPAQRPAQVQRPAAPAQRPQTLNIPQRPANKPAFVPQPKPANPIASRPGAGGGGIQNINPGNRPNIGGGGGIAKIDRPNIGGGGGIQRPDIRPGGGGGGVDRFPNIDGGNRPNIGGGGGVDRFPNINGGNRPNNNLPNIGGGGNNIIGGGGNNINRPIVGIGNRPNIDINNRPNFGDRNNFIGNNVNVNRPVNINNQVNRGVLVNRPNGGIYRPGYAHYHGYYNNWHHGYWNGWYNRPWYGYGAGIASGLFLGSVPEVVYSNPYYEAPSEPSVVQVFDYSQPIQVPQAVALEEPAPVDASAPAIAPPADPVDEKAAEASKILDEAREAFKAGDYQTAQTRVDKAIQILPNDATLHEFRALVLFARKQYSEAASTIYAVLAVGPGWDWDTLKTLYPDASTYTAQLRALEEYCKANPKDAGARFLLAYQYLVLDSKESAAKMFKSVVELQPKDELAAYMLKMLEQPATGDRPAPM